MSSFLSSVAKNIKKILKPFLQSFLGEAHFHAFLQQYGWTVDEINASALELINTELALKNLLEEIVDLIKQLEQGMDNEIETTQQVIEKFNKIVDALNQLSEMNPDTLKQDALKQIFPFNQNEFWQEIPPQLINNLFINHLESEYSVLYGILLIFGLIELELVQPSGQNRMKYVRRSLRLDRLGTLVDSPESYFSNVYQWNDESKPLLYKKFLEYLQRFFWSVGIPARLIKPSQTLIDHYYCLENPDREKIQELRIPVLSRGAYGWPDFSEIGITIVPIPSSPPAQTSPTGFLISPLILGTAHEGDSEQQVGEEETGFSLSIDGAFQTNCGFGLRVLPGSVDLEAGQSGTSANAQLTIIGKPETSWILIGTSGSHRLELEALQINIEVKADTEPEFLIEIGTGDAKREKKLALVIQMNEADGFLGKILGEEPHTITFAGTICWSSKKGLTVQGRTGLEVSFGVGKTFGFAYIDTLFAGIGARDGSLLITFAISGSAVLGPVTVAVERFGAELLLEPRTGEKPPGNLGSLDLNFGFKPPSGLGILIQAGPIVGGGFLSFDQENGRYTNILYLSFGSIAITAVGLIDTKLPGGQPGYSFLIIITAHFSPITLAYGFVLTGLGGLAGVNRTIVVPALQDGVRSGSLGYILFPENPIRDAPRLVNDIRTIFPPAEGRYVFGPMAQIGWPVKPLITIELGIILELPAPIRIVLLGRAKIALPKSESAVIKLNIDIAGILDLGAKCLSIDASIYDSYLACWSLYGDMAFRLSWADPPIFALSVGGLHPQFQPPPGFPTLRRMTLALGSGENPRLSLQSYLALTANTLQFGALVELYVEKGSFNISGSLGFDVLLTFVPFSLQAELDANVSIRKGSKLLAAVHLSGTLTGPTPWRIRGEASVSLLFLKATVDFDCTFGPEEVIEAVLGPSPLELLEAEIKAVANWSALLPPAITQVVALADPTSDEEKLALIDPLGALTLRQRSVPLDWNITFFGQVNLDSSQRFVIQPMTLGGTAAEHVPVLDYFAPAQYENMSDADKLSRPSFEQMQAGFTLATNAIAIGSSCGVVLGYETEIINQPDATQTTPTVRARSRSERASRRNENRNAQPLYIPTAAIQAQWQKHTAAAKAPVRTTGLDKYAPSPNQPPRVTMAQEEYTVTSTDDLSDLTPRIMELNIDIPQPRTKSSAYQLLDAYVAKDPSQKGKVQVMPLCKAGSPH